MESQILSICLNPVIQKTILLPQLIENHVNRSNEYFTDASGKGINVTRVLTQLGQNTVHLTQLGGRFREYFLSLTNSDQLQIRWAESFSEIRSCYTLLSQSQHTSTEIVEEAQPVEAQTETRVLELFQKLLPACQMIIISGTKAAGFSDAIFPQMVRMAKLLNKTVILDFRGTDLINSIEFKPNFIKPNYQEFVATFFPEMAKKSISNDEALNSQVREKILELFRKFGITTILTRGEQEILFVNNGEIHTLVPEKIMPVNTIGCGDAFTAGFATEWLQKKQLLPAVKQGLECAKRNALLLRPGVVE